MAEQNPGAAGHGREPAGPTRAAAGQPPDREVPAMRAVTDVATLRALADPLRLGILTTLMSRTTSPPRVMSVKELAAELDQPQTRLYRHVKQLEETGLIHVAGTRLVSGILEQRYQASQRDLAFGPGLLRGAGKESVPVIGALLDRFFEQFLTAYRAGQLASGPVPAEQAYREPVLAISETRLAPERAAALRGRLQDILDELNQPGAEDPDGVPVNLLVTFFSPG